MQKILFFDLETTGVDPKIHGIHQIAGMIEIDGEIKERFNYQVKPFVEKVIEDEALKVAGVTLEKIQKYPSNYDVYNSFVSMLGRYVDKFNKKDKFFLAGYNNASFDNPFLRQWFLDNKDTYFGSWFWSNCIDIMVLATEHLKADRSTMFDFKLKTVAEKMGVKVEHDNLHDAMYDIEITRAIYHFRKQALNL